MRTAAICRRCAFFVYLQFNLSADYAVKKINRSFDVRLGVISDFTFNCEEAFKAYIVKSRKVLFEINAARAERYFFKILNAEIVFGNGVDCLINKLGI